MVKHGFRNRHERAWERFLLDPNVDHPPPPIRDHALFDIGDGRLVWLCDNPDWPDNEDDDRAKEWASVIEARQRANGQG